MLIMNSYLHSEKKTGLFSVEYLKYISNKISNPPCEHMQYGKYIYNIAQFSFFLILF